MAVKRRAVWFSDEVWGALSAGAAARGRTVSVFIQELMQRSPFPAADPGIVGQPWDDGGTMRVSDGARFNSRPFTPVPKRK